jgi:hypothetical protein
MVPTASHLRLRRSRRASRYGHLRPSHKSCGQPDRGSLTPGPALSWSGAGVAFHHPINCLMLEPLSRARLETSHAHYRQLPIDDQGLHHS